MGPRPAAVLGGFALLVAAVCGPGADASPAERSAVVSVSFVHHAASDLGLRTGWGPTQAELDQATRYARSLSLENLAGQTIVTSYEGTGAPVRLVRRLHLGGIIASGSNIDSATQIRRSNEVLRQGVPRRWPLWVSLDQEGGLVQRVTGASTLFPAFMSTGAANDVLLTRDAAHASGAELVGLGFNVDFAPVGDVTIGPADPTIGSRSASSYPRRAARQVVAASRGFRSSGVLAVVKHFPGHGSVTTDSHETLPVQKRTLAQLEAIDWVPFHRAVEDRGSAIMVGHIDLRAVDPGVPSSLSRRVITGVLRQRFDFDGLVVTDSLSMGALASSGGRPAVRALRAGADVLLMPPDPARARSNIVAAVRAGHLSRARVEQAAARQIAMLLHLRGLHRAGARPGSGAAASYHLSAGAVTVASGPCRGRLVGASVAPVGPATAVRRFITAAHRAGLATGSGTRVALIGYRGSPVRATVMVALDTPYVLAVTGSPIKIATYGDTPGAMRALVRVLLGRAAAPGQLPVRVSGVPRTGC